MMLFLSPGLLPGKTLSSSDLLWFQPPWVATKPPGLKLPSNPDLGDAPEQIQPFLRYAAAKMPHVPLWTPNIVGGRPFHGDAQSSLFGPYTWPAYLLPLWTALGWIAVLKLWVAGFGTYLLGRSLGMRFWGALLAGIVYALNLKLVTWLIYPSMGVWTWYPWLLFSADRLVRRPDLLTGAGLAAVVAAQFLTGHPESSFHALLVTVIFFTFRLWQGRRAGAAASRRLRRPVLAFVAALGGGAALAAASLIPVGELLWLSADFVDRRGQSVDKSLPLKDAIGIFLPDFWGRPTQTPIVPIMLERAMYVGALPLMLAGTALMRRRIVERTAVALFGAGCFAVVLGIPPFLQVVSRLPVFNAGHNSRLIVFTILAVALLAGWGLDDLSASQRTSRDRRQLTLALSAALLLLPAIVVWVGSPKAFEHLGGGFRIAWLFGDPPGSYRDPQGADVIRASALLIWLAVAGAGLLLLSLRFRRRLGARAFVGLAVFLVCVDLFRAGVGQNPAIDRKYASVPETGAIRYLARQRPARFVSTNDFPQNVIPFDFDLYEARGYDIPIFRRYDRLWRREVTPGASSVAAAFLDIPLRLLDVTPRALRTLRLLGVTHLLGAKTLWPAKPPFDRLTRAPPLHVAGLTLVYDGPDARVYRINGALPRAWVVGAQRVVSGDGAARRAITRPDFHPRLAAVTGRRLPGLPDQPAAKARAAPSSARIARYDPERVIVRARTARPGLLVLSDNQYPGWKATVDGHPAPVERVDYLFRGVRIAPGSHTVEFRYEPLSWRIGWIVSLVSLVGLAVLVAVGWRRRRRKAPSRAEIRLEDLGQVERDSPARA